MYHFVIPIIFQTFEFAFRMEHSFVQLGVAVLQATSNQFLIGYFEVWAPGDLNSLFKQEFGSLH